MCLCNIEFVFDLVGDLEKKDEKIIEGEEESSKFIAKGEKIKNNVYLFENSYPFVFYKSMVDSSVKIYITQVKVVMQKT